MKLLLTGLFCITSAVAFAQDAKTSRLGSFTGALGSSEGSVSIDFFHLWKMGKSGRFEAGVGGRFTSYFGNSKYFSSAPASLAGDDTKSDSVLFQYPQINALNVALNFGYNFSPKFGVGFNIDAIGFSFGGSRDGSYINGNQGQATSGKPTSFNLLLVGNNDRGSLNSEFYVRYFLNNKLAVKLAYQYLFLEYTTDTTVQQVPEANDRFRHKARMVSVGITKTF